MEMEQTDNNTPPAPPMIADPDPGPNNNPQSSTLGEEMKMMENRLYESLKTLLKDTINTSLKPIQESIDKLQATQITMETDE